MMPILFIIAVDETTFYYETPSHIERFDSNHLENVTVATTNTTKKGEKTK